MAKGKVFITRAQEFRMNQLLDAHGEKGADGYYEYDAGWDDEGVAKIIRESFADAGGVSRAHVASCRLAVFGATRPAPPRPASNDEIAELRAAVAKLINEVAALKAWAAQRPRAPYGATVGQTNGVGAHV